MTPTDAREQLRNANDKHTYRVTEDRWYYSDSEPIYGSEYSISILPGLDGTECTRLTGQHLQLILTDALTAIKLHQSCPQ